jgi:hypothetical protein
LNPDLAEMRQYPAAFLFLVLHLSNQNSEVNKNPKKCIYGAIRKRNKPSLTFKHFMGCEKFLGIFQVFDVQNR